MNIAITGAGIVSAIGADKASVLRSLQNKETGIGPMRYLHSAHTELPVGEVKMTDDELKRLAGIDENKVISRTALMGIEAARQALSEAKIDSAAQEDGKKIGIISGTTVAGMDVTEKFFDEAATGGCGDCSFIRGHECGANTRIIAGHLGISGRAMTISTACSSAANAIAMGARMIEAGEVDIVVAGGAEALSRFHLAGFNSLMILDHERCRPFDASRAGLNLGEGAAYVVLESRESAQKRGVEPLAYVSGWGNACDAFHQTASSDNGEGAYLAMRQAIDMAGLKPQDIQYVNAHGTGTPSNDKSESAGLRRIFGEAGMPCVSSTKSATGHTTSASGSIEVVICLLAMQKGFVPANIGFAQADDACIRPAADIFNTPLENVLCNSFGFGGNDTSLVLSRHPLHPDGQEKREPIGTEVASEVTLGADSDLGEIRDFVKPMEARRMGKLAKIAMLSAFKALREAEVEMPDAIVSATRFGSLTHTENILGQIRESDDETVSPTDFMQSTHNTMGSAIAIKLGCHGYNVTYSDGHESLADAIADAKMLISNGLCKTVLVCGFDEMSPGFGDILRRSGEADLSPLTSTAIVLKCKK